VLLTAPAPETSRSEWEKTSVPCPQGCTETDPAGRGLRRVTYYTGEYQIVSTPRAEIVADRTKQYLECPVCGLVVDT
jgi:hypothetical protein